MSHNQSNNKRIVKNTLTLSVRMLLTMGINIYASRVIMQNLGVEDFGIYNVVGGIVAMFSVLTVSLITGTQRYLNYYLGKGNADEINSVYSTSINIFLLFGIGIVLLGETIGLYFLNYKLVIPEGRYLAANIVLQFSLAGTFLKIISSPFDALIVANEKMSTFAYVSVFDSSIRCGIAIILVFSPFDRLISYSFLLFLLYLGIRIFYSAYCKRTFPKVKYVKGWDRRLFKEMFSFSSWTLLGCFTFTTYTQGMTFLINMFFGPVVNAAQALAYQANAALTGFRSNFIMAAKPQITKSYAEGNINRMHQLVFMTSKLAYFIIALFAIPLIFKTEYVLHLWLREVPTYTAEFLQVLLITTIWSSLSEISVTAIQATGQIKKFQLCESFCLLLILPTTYIAFLLEAQPSICYYIMLVFFILAQFARLYFMNRLLNVRIADYVLNIIVRMLLCIGLSGIIISQINNYLQDSLLHLLVLVVISSILTTICFYMIGLTQQERIQVNTLIRNKIKLK